MPDILTVSHLTKSFGKLYAVNRLSFEVKQGEILGIMGPNGAGKTTVFNLLTGSLKPDTGSILFQGKEISKDSPASRCRDGIGRTYQIPHPFEKMTVLENLLVGAVHGGGLSEKRGREISYDILNLIQLHHAKDHMAGGLPLLDRKRLELGRALATQPSLILLDEIAGGLTEKEAEQVLGIVKTNLAEGDYHRLDRTHSHDDVRRGSSVAGYCRRPVAPVREPERGDVLP